MLKMGGYGFLRFSLPIAPDASRELDWLIIALSLDRRGVHRIRGAGAAGHEEADRLLLDRAHGLRHPGRSSAFRSWRTRAEPPASRWARRRRGADAVARPGIGRDVPVRRRHVRPRAQPRDQRLRRRGQHHAEVRGFMVLFALANSGLPGTSGFVGEFWSSWPRSRRTSGTRSWRAPRWCWARPTRLWLVKRVIFGEVANDKVAALKDLNGREFLVLGVLAAAVLLVGLWPAPLLDVMRARPSIWPSSCWSRRSFPKVSMNAGFNNPPSSTQACYARRRFSGRWRPARS
jgi:NADH-quinone oxidoreductase subunit M